MARPPWSNIDHEGHKHERTVAMEKGPEPRFGIRRDVCVCGALHRHLLPPFLPEPKAPSRIGTVLPCSRTGRTRRVSPLPPLPPNAGKRESPPGGGATRLRI